MLAADSAPVGLSKMSRTLTLTLADVTVSDASDAFGNMVGGLTGRQCHQRTPQCLQR